MEGFTIKGNGDYLELVLVKVDGFPHSPGWLGYELTASLEIKSGSMRSKSEIWTSTGQLYQLYESLKTCYDTLKGQVNFSTIESDLEINIHFDVDGHVIVTGEYSEQSELTNRLTFGFRSDQTHITNTIAQLEAIVEKYGGTKGKKSPFAW